MILEEETFEGFGYYPNGLKPKSGKRILAACDSCGKVRITSKHIYRSLCKSCGSKGERAGRFGKGEKNSNWAGGKIKRICQTCEIEFPVDPNVVKRGEGIFCSLLCSRKARKIRKHHTKPELIFERICKNNNLPFKYTGDGSFWVGKNPSVNPDFVECNGKKIAIEIFSYWHDPLRRHCKVPYNQTYEGRKRILKKYGWKLVVFWHEDLVREDAEQFVLTKLQKGGIT